MFNINGWLLCGYQFIFLHLRHRIRSLVHALPSCGHIHKPHVVSEYGVSTYRSYLICLHAYLLHWSNRVAFLIKTMDQVLCTSPTTRSYPRVEGLLVLMDDIMKDLPFQMSHCQRLYRVVEYVQIMELDSDRRSPPYR